MSNLRIIGLLIGLIGIVLTFRFYRGQKWKRVYFLLYGLFSFSLIAVSLNPNILNSAIGMFALQLEQRGRILFLLISSTILFWFILLHIKGRLDDYRHQFDMLIRNMAHEEQEAILRSGTAGIEIMIVIPSYNESQNLMKLLSAIPSQVKGRKTGVLVVDDGSSDNTFDVVKKTPHFYIRNKINRGQGAASRLGYDVLINHNIKVGVTMDADGQHLAEEIEKLVGPIVEDECDLIIGSRVLGSSYSHNKLRSFGIWMLTKIINILTGLKLTDCSSGFKAFSVEKMKKLCLTEDQFQSSEVLIEAAKKGLRIQEVPITIAKRQLGGSKKGTDWSYGLNFVKTILKTWWR